MSFASNFAAMLPLVAPLPNELSAVDIFRRISRLPQVIFFDSCDGESSNSKYSFVAADPFLSFVQSSPHEDGLQQVERAWKPFACAPNPDLPPFQGGVAGLFGYELAQSLERIPSAATNDLPTPTLAVGLYDVVFAFDHTAGKGWIISQGFPETDHAARLERAQVRLDQAQSWLANPITSSPRVVSVTPKADLAQQFDTDVAGITSNLPNERYHAMVQQAIDYIYAGDVFQVNLAQRLLSPAHCDPVDLYLRLREKNPAPFAGYFDLGDWQICSTSPECFLTVREDQVETHPIKGTRGRSGQPEADLFAGNELRLSEKDRAENVMIVDLLRNDLSRACLPDSVFVDKLCEIETYAFVKHLVSSVRGTLHGNANPFDLLRACFPGGSITGAPKIRAMEIIAQLEPTARGAYCGSLGYIGFDGQMDSSILIRTITAGRGWWQFPVGGGIVAQSRPEDEYRETWHKARGMLAAIMELADQ